MNHQAPTSAELANCPFCNGTMEPFGPDQFNHPRNDCWLASVRVERHEFAAWNRRAAMQTAEPVGPLVGCGDGNTRVVMAPPTIWKSRLVAAPDRAPSIAPLPPELSAVAPKVGPLAPEVAPSIAPDASDADALSALLWLYRRLPHGYERQDHIERVIKALAIKTATDVEPCLAERAWMSADSAPTASMQPWQDRMAEQCATDHRNAKRWEYIDEHATTKGGGNGFTIACHIPFDCEDMGCGVDQAIAALQPEGE